MKPRMRQGRELDQVMADLPSGPAPGAPLIHRETANMHDLASPFPAMTWVPETLPSGRTTAEERAVLDMAREYYRTGGETHSELMDAVQQLEQAYLNVAAGPATCFCGTGREHERGSGYHCGGAER